VKGQGGGIGCYIGEDRKKIAGEVFDEVWKRTDQTTG
jgi:hypothetical protein